MPNSELVVIFKDSVGDTGNSPLVSQLREKRFSLLQALKQQGLVVLGDYDSATETPSYGELMLRCPSHGDFTMRPINIRRALAHAPAVCPACRIEKRKGCTVGSLADVPEYIDTEALWRSRFQAFSLRIAKLFGEDALDLGNAPYEGVNIPRVFSCKKQPEHGCFTTKPKNLLRLSLKVPCPKCRESIFEQACETSSEVRGKGGYLYLIEDVATYRRYVGITTSTPEIRFAHHLQSASLNASRPMYQAMTTRPKDFRITPLSYYYSLHDLAEAEKAAIAELGTLWPGGYNLSRGGEICGRQSPRKQHAEHRSPRARAARRAAGPAPNHNPTPSFVKKCQANHVCPKNMRRLMIERAVDFEQALALLEQRKRELGWTCTKVTSLSVGSSEFTEGFVKTCAALGLQPKAVRNLMATFSLSREAAIERALVEKEAKAQRLPGPVNKLEIQVAGQVFTGGFEAACKTLKVNVNRVRAIMKAQGLNHSAAIEQVLKQAANY